LSRNRFLKHVTEGKIEKRISVTKRRVRRHKQLLDGYFKKIEDTGNCKRKH